MNTIDELVEHVMAVRKALHNRMCELKPVLARYEQLSRLVGEEMVLVEVEYRCATTVLEEIERIRERNEEG